MSLLPAFAAAAAEESDERVQSIKKGEALPPLAVGSNLPLQSHQLRRMKAIITVADLPAHMRSYEDETWKQELLAAVKKPACLVHECTDLFELLIVVNFWLCISQDVSQKDAIIVLLKGIYRAQTKSNQKLMAQQKRRVLRRLTPAPMEDTAPTMKLQCLLALLTAKPCWTSMPRKARQRQPSATPRRSAAPKAAPSRTSGT